MFGIVGDHGIDADKFIVFHIKIFAEAFALIAVNDDLHFHTVIIFRGDRFDSFVLIIGRDKNIGINGLFRTGRQNGFRCLDVRS